MIRLCFTDITMMKTYGDLKILLSFKFLDQSNIRKVFMHSNKSFEILKIILYFQMYMGIKHSLSY